MKRLSIIVPILAILLAGGCCQDENLLCCATWCGPCVKEIPYFRALAEKFKGNDRICFISLSVDSDKDRDKWVKFVGEE